MSVLTWIVYRSETKSHVFVIYFFFLITKKLSETYLSSKIEFFVERKNVQDQRLLRFNVCGKSSRRRSWFRKRTAPDR